MRSRSNRDKGAAVVAMSLVVALAGFSYANAADVVHFSKNLMGLTYGTTVDPQTGELYETEPDLRAVRASNGAEGYAYSSDINGTLESLRSMNDAQRETLVNEKAEALIEASVECFGVKVFDESSAKDYLTRVKSSETKADAIEDARHAAAKHLEAALRNGDLSSGDLKALAQSDMLDGGVAALEAVGQTLGSDASDAAPVEVTEEAIETIHRTARENTAIQIPVYKSDGVTQIGTAPFYVM